MEKRHLPTNNSCFQKPSSFRHSVINHDQFDEVLVLCHSVLTFFPPQNRQSDTKGERIRNKEKGKKERETGKRKEKEKK
jgi:hypothetical protein